MEWGESEAKCLRPIAPPAQFQDSRGGCRERGRRLTTPTRLSASHNSLSVPAPNRADDSSFITSAMSHDALTDIYNVPPDSDIYTLPVDSLTHHSNRHHRRKRHRRASIVETHSIAESKRHSVPVGCATTSPSPTPSEPIHMTLQEVRHFLHTLYSGSSDSASGSPPPPPPSHRRNTFTINIKHHKAQRPQTDIAEKNLSQSEKQKKTATSVKMSFSCALKRTLCNLFRVRRPQPPPDTVLVLGVPRGPPFRERALPPLPAGRSPCTLLAVSEDDPPSDFAASIEKVKDYGWYWGPISGEAAEKVLSNEPDGSFIVRDSSDDHYIFSLTFKLNDCVRHVRIEHDQGNFSFGSCTKFKSQTIVEFIENAVEHSRSGRYLFFLHRRPVHGPMRVQLLHPVSRFKQVQSLQHICRFVIVKLVRRDLIPSLPLPRRMLDYLNSPHYYSEQLVDDEQTTASPSLHLFSFAPPPPRS